MDFSRTNLRGRVGSMKQLAFIRCAELTEGRGRGCRIAEVRNGSGLRFTVYPDRGMDVGEAEFKGVPLVWLTPGGIAAPAFYEPEGLNWLRTWGGGLMTGCGPQNVGGPNGSGADANGLHGRVSHTPAENFSSHADWDEQGRYGLTLSGTLRCSRVFGENLRLTRTISTALGDNSITIEERAVNDGFASVPFMRLFHMNFGWPLVDRDSFIEIPEHEVIPQNDTAAAGLAEWAHASDPVPGFVEQVFYHHVPAGPDGMASARLVSPNRKLALRVSYRTRELPYLVQWKQMGCGEYVMGLEPANCYPEGQENFARRGLLRRLEPGAESTSLIRISIEEL